jgi:hypothetical protein
MKRLRASLLASVSFLFLLGVQSCTDPAQNRQLLSVTISPGSGTAQGNPSQVQFVATGTYNTAPYTVTPLQTDWGVTSYPRNPLRRRKAAWQPAIRTVRERPRLKHG